MSIHVKLNGVIYSKFNALSSNLTNSSTLSIYHYIINQATYLVVEDEDVWTVCLAYPLSKVINGAYEELRAPFAPASIGNLALKEREIKIYINLLSNYSIINYEYYSLNGINKKSDSRFLNRFLYLFKLQIIYEYIILKQSCETANPNVKKLKNISITILESLKDTWI